MEQARYWMLTKRKQCLRSHVQAPTTSSYVSWEEQAFAEDSAGPLGGCIWPPRSYSCSFCRREFRSAQALGGHMNVHRRDRARLKQSPTPHDEVVHQNPCTSLGAEYPPQVCSLVYNPNSLVIASSLSSSRVSGSSTQENCSEQTLLSPPYSSSIVQEHPRGTIFSPPPSWSDSVAVRVFSVSDSKIEGEKNSMIQELGCGVQGEYIEPKLSVSLNLVMSRNPPSGLSGDEEEAPSSKRRRCDGPSLPFFLKPSSMEDLDLELRLGDRPKVK